MERALGMIRATLDRFGVAFDVWQSERALHDAGDVAETLRALDAKGYIDRHDDAVWLKTTALWGDDKDRVVVKSDGLPTYLLADIAYHRKKLARGFDELVRHLGLRPPRPHRAHAGGAEGVRLRPGGAAGDPDPERQPAPRRRRGEDGEAGGRVRHARRRDRRGGRTRPATST